MILSPVAVIRSKITAKTIGDYAFAVCALRLPEEIRVAELVPDFKSVLKTHLCKACYVQLNSVVDILCLVCFFFCCACRGALK